MLNTTSTLDAHYNELDRTYVLRQMQDLGADISHLRSILYECIALYHSAAYSSALHNAVRNMENAVDNAEREMAHYVEWYEELERDHEAQTQATDRCS